MILTVTVASTGTIGIVIIAAVLCAVGAFVAWADHAGKKDPRENDNNRGNLK